MNQPTMTWRGVFFAMALMFAQMSQVSWAQQERAVTIEVRPDAAQRAQVVERRVVPLSVPAQRLAEKQRSTAQAQRTSTPKRDALRAPGMTVSGCQGVAVSKEQAQARSQVGGAMPCTPRSTE